MASKRQRVTSSAKSAPTATSASSVFRRQPDQTIPPADNEKSAFTGDIDLNRVFGGTKKPRWDGIVKAIAGQSKICRGCGNTFTPRLNEGVSNWENRQFCGHKCSRPTWKREFNGGLVSAATAATILGLSRRHLQHVINRGELGYVKAATRVVACERTRAARKETFVYERVTRLFRIEDLDAWAQAHYEAPTAPPSTAVCPPPTPTGSRPWEILPAAARRF